MKIPKNLNRAEAISLFTWTWMTGSVAASLYFGFWLFPSIYDLRTSAVVEVYFQASDPSDKDGVIYYPNSRAFKKRYASEIVDHEFLYYSACQALPLSQRPICDTNSNWDKLDPTLVSCNAVSSCEVMTYRMSEDERYVALAGLTPRRGASFSISDLQSPSLSDPGGWGHDAQLPLFFVCLFLALKLGRALGEFLFTPYEK